MIDEQELRELAEAAEKDGDHIYTNPRDSNKWRDIEAWVNVASPAVVTALLDELATLRQERTAWRVTAENAEKDAARWKHLEYMYGRGIPMETISHYIARPERLDYSAELHQEHAAKETP